MKVTIVLPTLDEAPNIIPLIEALRKQVPQLHEIIVVDDDSKDGTWQLVEKYAAGPGNGWVQVLRRLSNPGLTNSLKDGIHRSTGDVVVWMDCDFSMPPELVPKLIKEIESGYDISVGSRFVDGGEFKKGTEGTRDSWVAVLLSRLMNYTIQILLHQSFKDYTSGFIAVRKTVLDKIELRGDYGEYFMDLMFRALRMKFRVIEIPYVCVPRLQGYSKTGQNLIDYLSRGWKYVLLAIRLRLS